MTSLQTVFASLAAGLFVFWIVFSLVGARRGEVPGSLAVLRYGPALRILGLILALTPSALTVLLMWKLPLRDDAFVLKVGAVVLLTSALSGALLIETVLFQVVLSEDGIARRSPWRGYAFLRWTEVTRVRYSAVNRWFVFEGAGGTIRVSRFLENIGELVRLARRKLVADRFANAAAVFEQYP